MANPSTCEHQNTEMGWSHGELQRCKDCGAVEDPYGSGKWNDIVMEAISNAAVGNTEAARHFANYIQSARQHGAPYPDLSFVDIVAAGELLREAVDEKSGQQSLNFDKP